MIMTYLHICAHKRTKANVHRKMLSKNYKRIVERERKSEGERKRSRGKGKRKILRSIFDVKWEKGTEEVKERRKKPK